MQLLARYSFLITFVVTLFAVLTLTAIVTYRLSLDETVSRTSEYEQNRLRQRYHELHGTVNDHIRKGHLDEIRLEIFRLATDPMLRYVAVVDSNGIIVYSSRIDYEGVPINKLDEHPEYMRLHKSSRLHASEIRFYKNGSALFVHYPVKALYSSAAPFEADHADIIAVYDLTETLENLAYTGRIDTLKTLGLNLAVILLVGIILYINITGRIKSIIQAARAFSKGELSARIPIRGKDELARIGETFNAMAHKLQIQQNLILDQKKTFETLYAKSADSLLLLKEGVITDCNESTVRTFMVKEKSQLVGNAFSALLPKGEESENGFSDALTQCETEGLAALEQLCVRSNGQLFWSEIVLTKVTIKDEPLIHLALRDITERKHNEKKIAEQGKELEYQANYDTLTRLPNRILFLDRLNQAIKRMERHREKLAVFFIDLDRFKEINDSFGHELGDEVLKHVAQKFEAVLRAEDTLSRLGGDEFTLLVDALHEPEEASEIAQKLIDTLQAPVDINGHQLYLTCSIGVSIYPDDADDAQAMLRNADSAMYRAKESGRNTYQYYTADMTEKAFERIVLESSLRDGLSRQEFSVYFQPQIDARDNSIIGLETLVRWFHPSLGVISPAKFIPLAEETGLIIPLGEHVLHSAMEQVSMWRSFGLPTGKLSVNLSPKQLRGNMVQTIADALERFDFDPAYLELEVTEGYVIAEPEEAIRTLAKLRELGVSIAMDDFGTGYSSLSYLKRLPIDKLKIDQSFVHDIPNDSDDKAITQAIISMARSLSLSVIAEGVETEEQLAFLMQEGCYEIQGYYFSRPLPAKECEHFLLSYGKESKSTVT